MTQASSGDTVRIHYSGKLKDGTLFDTSQGRDPVELKGGDNKFIPVIESSVIGMSVGEQTTVEIASDDAFGPHRPEAVQTLDRGQIPDEVELAVGAQVQATTPEGQQMVLKVVELDETSVTLDGNHPLAGEDLVFEIELVEIVEPAG
jgi:peptidylprolyl isomerase